MSNRRPKDLDAVNDASRPCILLLTKYPEPGRVKGRLAQDLSGDMAVGLYRSFVLDSIATLKASGIRFSVCFHPPSKLAQFREWLGDDLTYVRQRGRGLGERIMHSISDAFAAGSARAMAIGSDSPDLPEKILNEACVALRSHDAVVGPTEDGGYCLIGFTREGFRPSVFKDIAWSTTGVFKETMSRLNKAGLRTHVLPIWRDVDTIEDLRVLSRNLQSGLSYAPLTLQFIRERKVLSEI